MCLLTSSRTATLSRFLKLCKVSARPGRPVNRETVLLEIGERVPLLYLADLSGMCTGANAEYYLQRLTAKAQYRELKRISAEVIAALESGKPPDEILDGLEISLSTMRKKTVDTCDVDMRATLHRLVETVEARIRDKASGPSGIPTGLTELDNYLGGLQPGSSYLIGARSSVGKTSLALTMADYQVRVGVPIGFASLEMSGLQVVERLVSMRSKVPVARMKFGLLRDGDMGAILSAAGTFNGGMRIFDKPGLTLRGLRAWAHGAVGKGDRVLYIDYLGLLDISDDERPRWEVMGQVSRTIKGLARELCVPVVSLVQLNRLAAAEGEPELHHLRDSGSLEQDADVVLLLHRPEPKPTDGTAVHANLKIAKNRGGPTGKSSIAF